MVMAVNESVLKQGVDESLSTKLQILRQRRELLEEKLIQKNNELKNLCVAEAELTGILPPEIPLEPGESPPTFNRRRTPSFGPSTNVTTKIKNTEADELELDRQIQIGLAEAALRVINDLTENRAVRRKQRSVYQQCQRKLQDLDARLNFIRQSTGTRLQNTIGNVQSYNHNNTKHRMKKPRPPLSVRDSYVKPLYEQGGVSLSPQEPEHNYNRDYFDPNCQLTPPGTSSHGYISYPISTPVERINTTKFSEHEQNMNNNIYILPDQFRTRTLSQGAQRNTSPRGQTRYHEVERIHRPLTNSYSESDRLLAYRHYQEESDNVQKQIPHYRYMDNDIQHRVNQVQPTEEFYTPHQQQRYLQHFDHLNHSKNPPHIPAIRQRRDQDTISVVESRNQGPTRYGIDNSLGYWVRQNGDIVWYSEDKYIEKFGSLDRRKHNNIQHITNSDGQPRYHSVVSSVKNSTTPLRPNQIINQSINFEQPVASNRILRTQSLGSVESRQSNRESPQDKDSVDMGRRNKEKGWYETSLDSNCSPPPISNLRPSNSVRMERHYDHIMAVRKDPELPYRGRQMELHSEFTEVQREEQVPHEVNNVNRYYEAPKVLEIPAESKPTQHQDNSEITISLNSPTNHTIVQPGKYQPYREVTKPFEMSDFYKYSTKFRKRNEANQMAAALACLGNEASIVEHKSNPPIQNKPTHQLKQSSGQFYEPQ